MGPSAGHRETSFLNKEGQGLQGATDLSSCWSPGHFGVLAPLHLPAVSSSVAGRLSLAFQYCPHSPSLSIWLQVSFQPALPSSLSGEMLAPGWSRGALATENQVVKNSNSAWVYVSLLLPMSRVSADTSWDLCLFPSLGVTVVFVRIKELGMQ